MICRVELCAGCGDSAATTRPLKRHRSAAAQTVSKHGQRGCATQRAIDHCAVNMKGVPAKPQYPLRGSDGDGSLVSHRHIMQPAPWHRKKCPRIW